MKKILFAALALLLCLSLCACGEFVSLMPGTETPAEAEAAVSAEFAPEMLFDFLGWDEFAQNYYADTPIAVSYALAGEGPSPLFDRESIIKACDALRGMQVIAPLGEEKEADSSFIFTMADGTTHTVRFAGRDLDAFTGDFSLLGGEELWALAFPCYAEGFDAFDLYQDEAMRRFADEFETNMPVSVGRRANGGATLTSEDAEVVRRAFELLKNARPSYVDPSPDQNINLNAREEYIFTMPDGSTVTILFTGNCLTVQPNSAYGPIYYHLEGISELFSMEILPANTHEDFAGGAITGLRADIQEAADCAEGLVEGKTVIGFAVDYILDGQPGLVTLSEDDAVEMMRRFAELQVGTDKLVGTAEGDSIVVSVTLSDGSGPFVIFAGDMVQETVGTWYPCEAASFAEFRQLVLDTAAEQSLETDEDDEE